MSGTGILYASPSGPDPILDQPMDFENDACATTVRDYLKALLLELWKEREGFSGKRPFGNSGWQFDLYKALIVAGAVPGKLDEDGFVQELDDTARRMADDFIGYAIARMCHV